MPERLTKVIETNDDDEDEDDDDEDDDDDDGDDDDDDGNDDDDDVRVSKCILASMCKLSSTDTL